MMKEPHPQPLSTGEGCKKLFWFFSISFGEGWGEVSSFLILVIFVFLFISFTKLHSGQIPDADSVKKVFPTVRVIGENISDNPIMNINSVYHIDSAWISQSGCKQVAELISTAPGVFVKDYGGLNGLKTISVRGTSSQQTLIMLDEIPLNSSQNGIFDLSLLPVSMISSTDVIRGGASGFFGGSALGGTVNFKTPGNYEKFESAANISYGSFNEMFANLSMGSPFSWGSGSFACEYSSTDGNYLYNINEFGVSKQGNRQDGFLRNLTATLGCNTQTDGWDFSARTLISGIDRGAPGAIIQGTRENSKFELNEKSILAYINTKKQLSNDLILKFSLSGKYDYLTNSSVDTSLLNSFAGNSSFINKEIRASGNLSGYVIGFLTNIKIEAVTDNLTTDELNNDTRFVSRNNYSISLGLERESFTTNDLQLTYSAGSRGDWFTDQTFAYSPFAGLKLTDKELPIFFSVSWSYNFRPPSFNEKYYKDYGNANLLPEKSHSLNTTFNLNLSWLQADFSGFYLNTIDQIVSVPTDNPFVWQAVNVNKVITRGIEFSADLNIINEILKTRISYTLQKATDESPDSPTKGKQIVYIPQEMLSAIVMLDYNSYKAGLTGKYVSYRFALPDNSYQSLLPAYFLLDIHLSKYFKTGLGVFEPYLEINNIFDKDYSIIMNYPMPGRIFRAGLSFRAN